ncbi:MAG: ComEC/Rec2 family competence protein [Clostridia bacterium]|nr:ComEC/Rec2 family competence protein [Clostridia bacterium]
MKRPLVFGVATLSAGLVCGFFFKSFLGALLIGFAVFGIGCFVLKQRWWVFLLASSFFLAGLLGAMLHIWTRPELPQQTRMITEARVISVPKDYGTYSTAVIKADKTRFPNAKGELVTVESPLYFSINSKRTSLSIGDTIRVYGDFKQAEKGRIYGNLKAEQVLLTEDRFNNFFTRFARNCSEGLGSYIKEHYSGEKGALLAAILTGDQNGLSKSTKDAFSKAGISHLVAVSGMNISILIFLFTALAFFIPRRLRLLITLPLLLFLVVFTGGSPSILRAAVMSATFLLADFQGRDSDGLTNLFVAVGVLLLMDYDVLYDVSFQLSFSAVLGLILGMPLLTHPIFERWYGRVLGATMMAQLGALPISVAVFGNLYPYSLLTNLILVPLFPATIVLSLSVIVLTLLIPPLGQLVLPMSGNAISFYLWLAERVSKLPGAVVELGDAGGEVGVFLACALAAAYLLLLRKK